ncbi:hypothetical protein SLA2020_116620 [Shorea laevis]
MLQILEDGRLTDNTGKTVDFKSTIIIMTSNVGGDVVLDGGPNWKVSQELKKNFRAEFLNRIDEVMIQQVSERVKVAKDIGLQVTEKLKKRVLKEGSNPCYGARPLKRAIVRMLEDNLADKILNGFVKEGSSVIADVGAGGNISFNFNV